MIPWSPAEGSAHYSQHRISRIRAVLKESLKRWNLAIFMWTFSSIRQAQSGRRISFLCSQAGTGFEEAVWATRMGAERSVLSRASPRENRAMWVPITDGSLLWGPFLAARIVSAVYDVDRMPRV
jgi:hypothetical protein